MSESEFETPRPDDRLLRGDVPDFQYNAVLGQLYADIGGWYSYLTGYKECADRIVESVVGTNGRHMGDNLAYPAVFLYRHHFELSLKTIILIGARVYEEEVKPFNEHGLVNLWRRAIRYIERHWPESESAVRDAAMRLLKELEGMDPRSMCFRYPETQAGESHIPETVWVNMRNLGEVAGRLSNYLMACIDGLWTDLDNKETFLSDMRSDMGSIFGDAPW